MKRLGIYSIDFGKLGELMDLPEGHRVVGVREWQSNFGMNSEMGGIQVKVEGSRMPECGDNDLIEFMNLEDV